MAAFFSYLFCCTNALHLMQCYKGIQITEPLHSIKIKQQCLGRRFGASKMYLPPTPLVALAAVWSKAVVLLLVLIYCLMYFLLFVGVLCLSLF